MKYRYPNMRVYGAEPEGEADARGGEMQQPRQNPSAAGNPQYSDKPVQGVEAEEEDDLPF